MTWALASASLVSICVCVSSEALANQLVKKGVLIDCQRRKAERYWTARLSDQCRSCHGFGHHWKRCNTSPRCHLCGKHKTGEHACPLCPTSRGKRCPHPILRCANCEGDHRASDRTCPVITRLREGHPIPDKTLPTPPPPWPLLSWQALQLPSTTKR